MKTDIQLNADAIRVRDYFGYGNKQPLEIRSTLLSRPEYTLVALPFSKNISGMALRDGSSKIVVVNSTMSLGRQRFSAAHELYHLEVEAEDMTGTICASGYTEKKPTREREADRFASYFLMPYDGLEWYIATHHVTKWDLDSVIRLSQYYRLSYQATLFRLNYDGRINANEQRLLQEYDIAREILKRGIDPQLYFPTPEDKQEQVNGEYHRIIDHAYEEEILTEGLYKQFKTEGFRFDNKNPSEKGMIVDD